VRRPRKVKKRKGVEDLASSFQGTKINPSRFHRSQIKFYTVLVPLGIFMIMPIIFLFSNAFKPMDELFAYPPAFFVRHPTLNNFKKLLSAAEAANIPATRYIFNTIVLTLLVILFCILLSVSAGYALSKKSFRIKKVLFEINTMALMFVPIAVSVPRYLIMVRLGLVDTFAANIVPIIATPVGLFLIKQFIDGIPDSLIEAAKIDGANDIRILSTIVIPLAMPALATVAILSFQSAWGSVEASQLYINNESYKSFAYYMATFVSTNDTVAGAGISAAATLIMFIPNLIIFIFLQSKVMNTMAYSGIK
jgi:ABC-type glycerol-3-phosphate transport system permease component